MLEIKKGFRSGRLTVLKEGKRKVLPSGLKPRTVDCLCDCGNETNILLLHFTRKRTLSCGCIKRTRNGLSDNKLYKVYKALHDRCDGKTKNASRYLGRNITVCDEWVKDYMKFINWSLENGYKEGLQIDRIDNDKGYSPENCRWTTNIVNANNRENTFKVVYKGIEYSFCDLIRKLNKKNPYTIRARINRGWDVEKAFDKPTRKGNYKRNDSL